MKKLQNVVIITLVLLVPVLVYLFLKGYGSNQFDLPIYYEQGNPLAECSGEPGQHRITQVMLSSAGVSLPILIYFTDTLENEYYSDLDNVIHKYPRINILELSEVSAIQPESTIEKGNEDLVRFINCELVLGETEWLSEPIPNKYVLIDQKRRIRGYFDCTDLADIERLDTELDILLNH